MDEDFKQELITHAKNFETLNETEIAESNRLITQIHILDGCNLRCKHCYVGDRRFKPNPPLSLQEIVRRIEILKKFQVRHGFEHHTLNISGGEPTIHPNIFEIVKEIVKRDISPILLTNGMKIDEEFAQKLKKAGLEMIQISLEGPEDINDSIRGEGVYKKALEAVDILNTYGFRIIIGITISKYNMNELEKIWSALDGKVKKFHMREVTPIGAAENFEDKTREERWKIYKKIFSWKGKTRLFLEDPPYCTTDPDLIDKRAGCAAFICLLCVDTDGSIYPCRKAPYKMGTIDDIEEAWNNPIAIKMRNREFNGPCGECHIKGSCGGCRGYCYAHGNILGSDTRCFLQFD